MVVGSGRGRTQDEVTARRNLLIAAMPVLLGGGDAVAQEATTTLDPINIQERDESAFGTVDGYVATQGSTATKTDTPLIETPQSISVITKDQMEAQAVDSLNSALRYTPGATGNLYGTDNRGHGLQMRGISNSSGVFYKDGLQLKESNFTLFTALDSYGAERYEILRGPASVLYGQASPGGIINYVSKRPTEETLREVELGAGSFDRYEGKFDFSGAVNADKSLLFRLTGAAHTGDTQTDFVEDDRIFIAPALTWQPDADTSLTILANYQRDRSGWAMQYLPAYGTIRPGRDGKYLPNSMFVGEPGFDTYDNDQASIGYELDHRFNETWQVRQHARYVYLKHYEEGVFGGGLLNDEGDYSRYADAGGSRLSGVTIDNQAQADFDTGPLAHTLLLGLDYKRYTYRDYAASNDMVDDDFNIFDPVYGYPVGEMTPYTDTDTTQSQVGLYAQDQIKLGNWRLTLGGPPGLGRRESPRQSGRRFRSPPEGRRLHQPRRSALSRRQRPCPLCQLFRIVPAGVRPRQQRQSARARNRQAVRGRAEIPAGRLERLRHRFGVRPGPAECRTLWRCWRAQRHLPDRRDQVARYRAGSCCQPRFRLRFPGGLYISRHRDHQGHLDHR